MTDHIDSTLSLLPKLTDFKVLAFDVYGTLVDWDGGMYTALQPMLSAYPSSSKWTRKQALAAFESICKDLQKNHPDLLYSEILAKTHQLLEDQIRQDSNSDITKSIEIDVALDAHKAFAASIKDWEVFSDTVEGLRTLSKYYKLVVLSNTDHAAFAYTHARLSGVDIAKESIKTYSFPDPNPDETYWFPQSIPGTKSPFTFLLTAEDVKSYKPALKGFRVALDCIQKHPALLASPESQLQDAKDKVLWVANGYEYDILATRELGVKNAWIDRQNEVDSREAKWDWRFESLAELVKEVEKEFSALQKAT